MSPEETIEAWFNEEITVEDRESFTGPVQIVRKDRIAFLVYANGGFECSGYGCISGWPNGHQQGLFQDQFFALLQFCSFFHGVALIGPDPFLLFKPHYDNYLARVAAKAKEHQDAAARAPEPRAP